MFAPLVALAAVSAIAISGSGLKLSVHRARLIRVQERRGLVWLAAVVLSGACTGHNGSGPLDCTGGYVANGGCVLASRITGRQVAAQVEGYALPPMNSRRLTRVRCAVASDHRSATCRGWLRSPGQGAGGRWLTVRFHVNAEGGLRPVCRQCAAIVFCAD
jgi:hypothetical protein